MTDFDWTACFEGTRTLPGPVRERMRRLAQVKTYARGREVFGRRNIPDSLMFLLEGTIRVSQSSENGRDIVLYRVEAGESCVLTTACLLAEEAYNAEGLAETEIRVVALPRKAFDALIAAEPAFRDFVLAAYSRRMLDLLRVVHDVAFARIDVRLAERLLDLAGGDREILATHARIASELGTAREVVSRVLHDFQKRGFVAQSRGRIELTDKPALRVLAGSA